MALIFQRLARNFAKNGYFPTDDATLESILSKLIITDNSTVHAFDPCCGEGRALAEISEYLSTSSTTIVTHGIEIDSERANAARDILNNVIQSDIEDCKIPPRNYQLLFLNPPYGNIKKNTYSSDSNALRFEKLFYRKTVPSLSFGGILILIIPHYVIDDELSSWIARHFQNIVIGKGCTDDYKQVVIMGNKRRSKNVNRSDFDKQQALLKKAASNPDSIEIFSGINRMHEVPSMPTNSIVKNCYTHRLDAEQLKLVTQSFKGLWSQFNAVFGQIGKPYLPTLEPMGQWHSALTLASGLISGAIVTGRDKRRLLVSGNTIKSRKQTGSSIESTPQDDGSIRNRTKTEYKEFFEPVINAIDITPGSDHFGDVFEVK